jgi:hypothetical protein
MGFLDAFKAGVGVPNPLHSATWFSVMPGLVPGIHVLAAIKQERRGWPGQARP